MDESRGLVRFDPVLLRLVRQHRIILADHIEIDKLVSLVMCIGLALVIANKCRRLKPLLCCLLMRECLSMSLLIDLLITI
jgi:hypothetical protein